MSFTPDQWLILLLAFVLGLVLGMAAARQPEVEGAATARRCAARARELEAENARLKREFDTERDRARRDASEMDSLRHAAARDEARHDDRRSAGAALGLPERRLRRRKPGDRHAVGRGADT